MSRTLSFSVCLIWYFSALAQTEINPGQWTVIDQYPAGRIDDGAAFDLDGKLFMGTGLDEAYNLRKDWWRYDPQSGVWTKMATLPSAPRQYALAFSTAEFAYLMGGQLGGDTFSSACFRYDLQRNEWKELPLAPWSPRCAMAGFEIADDIYVLGGRNSTERFSDMWRFDTKSGVWEFLGNLPFATGRDEQVAFSYGHFAYVALGRDETNAYNDIWRYDMLGNSWTRIGDFPGNAVVYASSVNTAYGAVVCGGENRIGELLSECYHFNGSDETWTRLPDLAEGRIRGMSMMALHDTVYTFGGLKDMNQRSGALQQLVLHESNVHGLAELGIYPNPAGQGTMVIPTEKSYIEGILDIYSSTGSLCFSRCFDAFSEPLYLNTAQFLPGVYHVRWQDNTGIARAKLVIAQ